MLPSGVLPSPVPLHIPDGFLSVAISVICWALTAVGVGVSLWRSPWLAKHHLVAAVP